VWVGRGKDSVWRYVFEKVKEGERCGCGLVGDDMRGFGREDGACVCVCVGDGVRCRK